MTDSDTIPAPDWLSKLVSALDTNPNASGVEGKVIAKNAGEFDPIGEGPSNLEGGVFLTCNCAYRRDALDRVGGFDESFPYPAYEDTDLAARVTEIGTIVWQPEAVISPGTPHFQSSLEKVASLRICPVDGYAIRLSRLENIPDKSSAFALRYCRRYASVLKDCASFAVAPETALCVPEAFRDGNLRIDRCTLYRRATRALWRLQASQGPWKFSGSRVTPRRGNQTETLSTPLVYVIVLTFNVRDLARRCLESLKTLSYPNLRVVVVDNASNDGTEEMVRTEFADLSILQTGNNFGYTGGNNRGIELALREGAEYVVVINPDTVVVNREFIGEMVDYEANRDVGISGPRVFLREKGVVQNTVLYQPD